MRAARASSLASHTRLPDSLGTFQKSSFEDLKFQLESCIVLGLETETCEQLDFGYENLLTTSRLLETKRRELSFIGSGLQ